MIFCLSVADSCGFGGGGIKEGMPSTARAFIRSQLDTMVQSSWKFKPPVGEGLTWQPDSAQLLCIMVRTAPNNGPAGALPTVTVVLFIQPSRSFAFTVNVPAVKPEKTLLAWKAPAPTLYVKPVLPVAETVKPPLFGPLQGILLMILLADTTITLPAQASELTVNCLLPVQPAAVFAVMV